MINKADFYYFSPTGGTKKTGEIFAREIAENVQFIDLGSKQEQKETDHELAVIAIPVFGGRLPAFASEKLRKINGAGKKAVTLAVYGTRAYEDALLELNDLAEECGFQVIASGAFVARHSIVPEVGAGRPDEQDAAELREFAKKVLEKIEKGSDEAVQVPGNRPYKQWGGMTVAPISLPTCVQCGKCATVCPTDAITFEGNTVQTSTEKCMLCMACTAACPEHARILPPPVQEMMNQKLGVLKDIRRPNEIFL